MKKLSILIFLFISLGSSAQEIRNDQRVYSYATTLKSQKGVTNVVYKVLNLTTLNDHNGGEYMWDSTTTASDDNYQTLQATGVTKGRYIKMLNNNTFTVHVVVTGVLTNTTYTVSFGQTLPKMPAQIIPVLTSASFISSPGITAKTTTGCTLNFGSVLSGTYEFDLTVIKASN